MIPVKVFLVSDKIKMKFYKKITILKDKNNIIKQYSYKLLRFHNDFMTYELLKKKLFPGLISLYYISKYSKKK